MISTCEICKKIAAGQYYRIHYGELKKTDVASMGSGLGWERTYQTYEHATFICDRCATPRAGWLSVLVGTLVGILLIYIGTQLLVQDVPLRDQWKPILFLMVPGLLLALFWMQKGIQGLRGRVAATPQAGEKAAIQHVKKLYYNRNFVYWTAREYDRLRPTSYRG